MAILNTGGNDVQIKTINNESLKGTGNITIKEVPDATSATAGNVLTLDSNKDAIWSAPSKELPATTSANAGDVLTLDSNKDVVWQTPSGGGDGWETIDINNLPTDLAEGDELEIQFGIKFANNYTGNDWKTAPGGSGSISFGNGNIDTGYTIKTVRLKVQHYQTSAVEFIDCNVAQSGFNYALIKFHISAYNFNNQSWSECFKIFIQDFNAGGLTGTYTYSNSWQTFATLKPAVIYLKRKRAN